MRLALIHRPRGSTVAPARGTTWTTCVREVTFLDAPEPERSGDASLLTDEQAYAVLVEIVCGIRSRLIGETEVQSQFKTFLESLDPTAHGPLRRLGQSVLHDAKRIRTRHLQGVGAHSYGRLALRYVTADRVAVIGSGALARDVVSRMPARAHADIWCRRSDVDPFQHACGLEQHLLRDAVTGIALRTSPTAVVIASPVSARDLEAVLACYDRVTEIVDLRAADEVTPLPGTIPGITLATLLADAESTSHVGAASVVAARKEIQDLAHAYHSREELHPAGWDDICA